MDGKLYDESRWSNGVLVAKPAYHPDKAGNGMAIRVCWEETVRSRTGLNGILAARVTDREIFSDGFGESEF